VSEIRPKLKAVEHGAKETVASDDRAPVPEPEPEPETGTTSRATWLLGGLLLLAFLALVIQTSRVGALSREVSRLSSDLAGARTALLAYEGRLATVREVVGDLSRRVGQLDELVRRDPLAPAEPEDLEPAPAPEAPAAPDAPEAPDAP
jgi:hypothetical protein